MGRAALRKNWASTKEYRRKMKACNLKKRALIHRNWNTVKKDFLLIEDLNLDDDVKYNIDPIIEEMSYLQTNWYKIDQPVKLAELDEWF